jgi:WD40 repeat protein
VRSILEAALDLPPTSRVAFLNDRCGADTALRREVESLIAADGSAERFLESHATVAPRRIGDYEILSEVARGGMGVVYAARQKRLDRIVALKVMNGGAFNRDSQVARFEVEAHAAANLSHPNIVPIHEIGEYEGCHYFSMPLVEGTTLAARLTEGQLTTRDAAILTSKLARAVHHAHQHGVLHRDLKPTNVLLDRNGEPHLTDFGLAKLLERDVTLTATDAIMGTPAYMSPEQARGDPRAVTTVTDVYGLGAVLYECLAGRPPFAGKTIAETLQDVLTRDPLPPSAVNASVDRDVETICLRCLEKEPSARYASAAALADDLDRYCRHEPILARPSTVWQRAAKWARRRPAIAALGAGLVLAVLGGLAGITWQWRRAEGEASRAVRAAEALRQGSYVSDMAVAYQAYAAGKIALARELLERQRPGSALDLRGFEWRRLYSLTRPQDVGAVRSARGEIWGGALSPDGHYFAGGSDTGWFQLWDAESGKEVAGFQSAPDTIYSVAFSPDGGTIAMPFGAEDMHSIQLWNVATRERSGLLKGHTQDLLSIVYSPDGKLIASSGGFAYDTDRLGEIIVWDATDPGRFTRLSGHASSVGFISFSPDGRFLATPHGDGRIHLWDVAAHRIIRTFEGHRGLVFCVRFSPDGTRIASGGVDGTVRLWDVSGRKAPTVLGWHDGAVYTVAFSPDGRWVASGGIDHIARIWDVRSGDEFATLRGHSDRVFALGFTHDGQRLVTSSADGTVRLWRVTGDGSGVFDRQGGVFVRLEFSPAGRWLIRSSENEGKVTLWRDLSKVATLDATFGSVSPDGKVLVTTSRKPSFDIWDLTAAAPVFRRAVAYIHEGVGRPVFSPDGRLLAIRTAPAVISVWTTDGMREGFQLQQPAGARLGSPAFSPRGEWIAASNMEDVLLWRLADKSLQRVKAHERAVNAIAFSPDGHLLATGGVDRTVRLWQLPGFQMVGEMHADAGAVMSLTFSRDGRTLVAGTQDGLLQLWNTPTRREITSWRAHSSIVSGLAFSPGDTLLATASVDHNMRLWPAPTVSETDR